MRSLWNDADARAAIDHWSARGAHEALALRTYTARLLGSDPALVLHGGGNTSVKTQVSDLFGERVDVLCVKGSGWDLARIEPPGHPAVRMAPLLKLRGLRSLSDEAMVNALRLNLMDAAAPTPSVETLLHAFIPETFIDHTHSLAVLALADQPDAEALIAEVYGDRVACVPYVMPGFDLALKAAQAYESRPGLEGLILVQHGVFSFGATARESYERMVDLVSRAEAHVARRGRARPGVAVTPPATRPAGEVLPLLRGVLAQVAAEGLGRADGAAWPGRWLFDLRDDAASADIAAHPDLMDLARRGVATPDHVIRTKGQPLVLPPAAGDLAAWRAQALDRTRAFARDYVDYFHRNAVRFPDGRTMLDPLPRVAALPGLGLAGLGKSAGEASVAADIAASWARTVLEAESIGRFAPVGEADMFDLEYWSLEQAKLGKAAEKRLERQVAVVTGGAGAIGLATARALAAEGAALAVIDLDGEAAARAAKAIGGAVAAFACDVTDPQAVRRVMRAVAARFGGVDIVVSNAGSAIPGEMAAIDEAALRRSFELNFFAHQWVAREAAALFRDQGLGGALLFNVSKQALNPGPGFGAYGTSKSALLSLMRQYALEHGADGVRVNAVNADRIRSGLLTPEMIATRSRARGVDEATYMAGNLLGREVTADDVAQAFVFLARAPATTGAVLTVDGGNVAAMVR